MGGGRAGWGWYPTQANSRLEWATLSSLRMQRVGGEHSLFAVLTFGDRARSFDGPNDGLGLVDRLLIFLLGNRICDDAATRLNVPLIAFHQHAADRDARIEVPGKVG